MAQTPNIPPMLANKLGELWSRLRFVFLAMIVYRVGAHIPVPGVNPVALERLFDQNDGTIVGLFNVFSGGALERMSVLALGIMPYISASIIIQLLSAVHPTLDQLRKEGESGRRKITQYTRYSTLGLAIIQSFGMAVALQSQNIAISSGPVFLLTSVISLVSGTMFLMWLGEQITERGIGNGISLIIFAGIVAGLPGAVGQVFEMAREGQLHILALLMLVLISGAVIAFVVFMEKAQRRLKVNYANQRAGGVIPNKAGNTSHLPLKVNMAGVIPPTALMPITCVAPSCCRAQRLAR